MSLLLTADLIAAMRKKIYSSAIRSCRLFAKLLDSVRSSAITRWQCRIAYLSGGLVPFLIISGNSGRRSNFRRQAPEQNGCQGASWIGMRPYIMVFLLVQ